MFKEKANAAFNNKLFSCAMIRAMSDDKLISEQMQRLYKAAKALKNISGKSNVARLLDAYPQNLGHWENGRPISGDALVKAQEKIGCDAIWLRDGTGVMTKGQIQLGLTAAEVTDLIKRYEDSDKEGRKAIMDMAQAMAKVGGSARSRAANDPQ